jgi:hypothetical protein
VASPSVFTVFDKDGAQIAGPTGLDTLWASGGAAGACLRSGVDPIVLYDRLADRWLMSQFVDDDAGGHNLCVSVSQTPDPVSCGWYLYDFPTPEKPDYPKYAVWPDAYYVSTNESAPTAYALDRFQMLVGLPATSQRFDNAPPLAGFVFQAMLPGDLDGPTPPPAGAPNVFLRHRDDERHR